jgi:hypothetical protein
VRADPGPGELARVLPGEQLHQSHALAGGFQRDGQHERRQYEPRASWRKGAGDGHGANSREERHEGREQQEIAREQEPCAEQHGQLRERKDDGDQRRAQVPTERRYDADDREQTRRPPDAQVDQL